jgi:protein SCO1/2|tara:strand:+ start:5036 stop:5713 length:678 start_codon:yes stop_codon:yes gene_type:complete
MTSKNSKRIVLVALLIIPVTMYLVSIAVSGVVNFRTLENLGPPSFDSGSTTFINDRRDSWSPDSSSGKIIVLSFFFTTCPTICPAMNFHLKEAHDRLYGFKDLIFISCTVDPTTDTPEILFDYKRNLGVEESNKWDFITGESEELYALANSYYLTALRDSKSPGGYAHSQSAVLIDWQGNLRSRITDQGNILGAYDLSEAYLIDQLVDDVRVLIKEHRKVKMGRK